MRLGDAGLESGPSQRRDHQGDDAPAGGIRAAPGVRAAFIPRDEQRPTVAECRRVEDGGHLVAEPGVPGRDGTVVHVVAHVGRDPDVVGDRSAREIRTELGEGHHVRAAARRIGTDVVVVDPGIVLLHVGIGIAHEARRRHALEVRLPAPATALDLVREVRRADPTGGAVARDAEGAAGRHGEVIRQARMANAVVLCRQPIALRQPIDVRSGAIPNQAARLLVFHHDREYVAEGRQRRSWSGGRSRRRCGCRSWRWCRSGRGRWSR